MRLAATDLANHLSCRHLTTLDRGLAEGRWKAPDRYRPEAEVLAARGLEHERAFLDHLEAQGRKITRLDDEQPGRALVRTTAAMYAGADVIAQATLEVGRWVGRADVLLKVERPSGLGAWSYEALDTKLAQETRAGAILQLCLYSDLLATIQGARPEKMHVVPRRPGFPYDTYRVEEYLAYYRFVRRRLEAAVDAVDGAAPATYPDPVPHCEVCRWWPRCDRERRNDDHLSFVAGLTRLQTRELVSHDVDTLAALAAEPLPIPWKPARGAKESYARVREQARIQLAGREQGRPLHELLALAPGRGLARLPEPSPGDLFLDLESDPYVDEGGLEYLFGWVASEGGEESAYHARWSLDRVAEREGFEALMDGIMARWAADPGMHVYHFSPYEPGALKRLTGRYASREREMDRLLRAERFVDLHAVVRQALRASVEEYSIKKLEPLYGYERRQPLEGAGVALRAVARALELDLGVDSSGEDARVVEAYNRDDCLSTLALRDWLERLRADEVAKGASIPRPLEEPGDPSPKVDEREQRAAELAARLLAGVSEIPEERTAEQHARWLLARMLDWHRREDKAGWWDYFRLRELSAEDLLDETAALSGLEFVETCPPIGRSRVDRYRFPRQETKVRDGDQLRLPRPQGDGPDGAPADSGPDDARPRDEPDQFGEVFAVDLIAGTVDIKKRRLFEDSHPGAVFAHESYRTDAQADSLIRLGEWVAANGVDAPGRYRAARDLLLRLAPRLRGHAGGALEAEGEGGVRAALRLVLSLDHGTLAIQGPPGSGKTFTGARMIADLVRAGKRVGVCAVSHKVITNLLKEVVKAGAEAGVRIAILQKLREGDGPPDPGIRVATDNAEALRAIQGRNAHVLGGTAWMWAREEFLEAVDVLFVDEAGQMSLANALAIGHCAKSLVLLGDPQQLEQPIQGFHPPGTAVSALEHVLGEAETIPPDRGLFLEETWRLAPPICAFTSELFYERRLVPYAALAQQAVLGGSAFAGTGLWYVPVRHDANQAASREEVAVVAELIDSLLGGGACWRDREGKEHPLALEDVLVIAPYNAQVADLTARLPRGARVGTVDRFQGQEAPIVIYSMTTSTPEDAPRGMDFLYDPHRFNVATSRAKCACIVVGSPRLFEPDCTSPKQIQLANAFCRYLELARVSDPARPRV